LGRAKEFFIKSFSNVGLGTIKLKLEMDVFLKFIEFSSDHFFENMKYSWGETYQSDRDMNDTDY